MRYAHITRASAALQRIKIAMPGEVIDMSDAIERAAAKRRKQNAVASRRTRDRKAGKHVPRKPPGPKPRVARTVAAEKPAATSATLIATVPVRAAAVPAPPRLT
jgi:hypothetical protein